MFYVADWIGRALDQKSTGGYVELYQETKCRVVASTTYDIF